MSFLRHLAILSAAVAVALVCAVASVHGRNFQAAGVVTQMQLDLQRSGITDRRDNDLYFDRLATRADVVAHLMATPPVLELIARRAHLPVNQIAADAPVTIATNGPLTE